MSRLMLAALLALAALPSGACATTRLVDTWKDPSTTSLRFRKVMVVVVARDTATRRAGEDTLVALIRKRGVEAVPAWTSVPDAVLRDAEKAKDYVARSGADGVVTMRAVGTDEQHRWVRGAYPQPYYSFWGYYRYAWPAVYDPGYLQTDRYVQIETNVYSLTDDKLVWAGVSETMNPQSVTELVDEVARTVGAEMKKQGLI